MKKPSAKSGRASTHLDTDEAALWSIAAETIEPLKRAKSRVHAAVERLANEPPSQRSKLSAPDEKAKPAAVKPMPKVPPASVKPSVPASKSVPPVAIFDKKKVRKLRTGQIDIEARIDLHGMRQSEAHAALRAFLARCLGKGQRWVLVITGKGKAEDVDDDAPFSMGQTRDRGVLKRNVPRWLEEPDIRTMVVSYTSAAQHHGGQGALYVHLRTKRT